MRRHDTQQFYRCRRCRLINHRNDCATRHGQIECGSCLCYGYVDLLEPCERPHDRCPECGANMIHERLRGYQCRACS